MIKKNTAGQFIYFGLVSTVDGSSVTGASPTGYVSIDGAAQGGIGGAIAEQGNGQYEYAMSQGDTNGDEIGYLFTNAGAISVSITITTETKKMADLNDLAAGAEMDLIDDAITSDKYDESSAYALESADTGASQIARVGADGDTLESISDQIDAVPDAADINAQVDLALTDIHLDHLLGVDFDSASPVGNATSFLRQMVENDAGTLRYTANTLEEAPSGTGGDATAANQTLILEDLADIEGSGFVKDTDSMVDLAKPADVPDAAAIKSECDDALTDIHLDHIFAAAYTPGAKPGNAEGWMNILVESDGGVTRFTENALEQAPSGTGGDASAANQVLILEDLADIEGTAFVKDTHSLVDGALAADLATTDGKIDTIDTNVDAILVDTGTTLDGKLDAILVDTGTTLDGKIDDVDTIVTLIQDILEGDQEINTAVTPWRHLIKRTIGGATLVEKELFQLDDSDVTASTDIVGNEIEPV